MGRISFIAVFIRRHTPYSHMSWSRTTRHIDSVSSRSFQIPALRRRNFRIYIILIANVDSMSGLRFNLDTLYVVPISVSLIISNYSLYLEYLMHIPTYNVYYHFNWAYQLRCTSRCVRNGLMYGRVTKFLNGRSPFLEGTSFRLVLVRTFCIRCDRGKKTRSLH